MNHGCIGTHVYGLHVTSLLCQSEVIMLASQHLPKLMLNKNAEFNGEQGKFDEFIPPDEGLFERNK